MNAQTSTLDPKLDPAPAPASSDDAIGAFLQQEYTAGFETVMESDSLPKGLSEDVIRQISARKGEPEFLLE